MRIYNTLKGEKEFLETIEPNRVKMYVCGMTVYDHSHIGHARTFLCFDMIVRYLRFSGYAVDYIRNITDVEDKIIVRSKELDIEASVLTSKYIDSMHDDFSALGMIAPDQEPKATENIASIINLIERLIEKNNAYVGKSDVYFSIDSFPDYGMLSRRNTDEMLAGARIEVDEDKRNPADFVLWKKAQEGLAWDSPWGRGRPGWHIECSAMSMEALGDSFDIHGGGMDLKFPHHENEIAQSKCSTGKDFASYWMHTGSLRIDQDKMSKSLDNFITIKDALKNYPSEVVRFFLISSHYRSPMNYSIDGLVEAQASLDRLYTALKGCELTFDTEENEFSVQYREIMEDDFNVPGALAVFFDMAKSINLYKESNKTDQANKLASSLISLAEPLGILQQDPELYLKAGVPLSEDKIDALIKERELARTNKDFKRSDQIRDELVNMNIVLEDSVEGTSWRRK
ncbi:MAG TPA: cysteine--tRNA ligase [Gammaproteobacteria bacterium]|jgi:cysteinyl-tRNA synthetase|nr:cysteine--tRNA ligase [Gammaproteobacteria bacterium]